MVMLRNKVLPHTMYCKEGMLYVWIHLFDNEYSKW